MARRRTLGKRRTKRSNKMRNTARNRMRKFKHGGGPTDPRDVQAEEYQQTRINTFGESRFSDKEKIKALTLAQSIYDDQVNTQQKDPAEAEMIARQWMATYIQHELDFLRKLNMWAVSLDEQADAYEKTRIDDFGESRYDAYKEKNNAIAHAKSIYYEQVNIQKKDESEGDRIAREGMATYITKELRHLRELEGWSHFSGNWAKRPPPKEPYQPYQPFGPGITMNAFGPHR